MLLSISVERFFYSRVRDFLVHIFSRTPAILVTVFERPTPDLSDFLVNSRRCKFYSVFYSGKQNKNKAKKKIQAVHFLKRGGRAGFSVK